MYWASEDGGFGTSGLVGAGFENYVAISGTCGSLEFTTNASFLAVPFNLSQNVWHDISILYSSPSQLIIDGEIIGQLADHLPRFPLNILFSYDPCNTTVSSSGVWYDDIKVYTNPTVKLQFQDPVFHSFKKVMRLL